MHIICYQCVFPLSFIICKQTAANLCLRLTRFCTELHFWWMKQHFFWHLSTLGVICRFFTYCYCCCWNIQKCPPQERCLIQWFWPIMLSDAQYHSCRLLAYLCDKQWCNTVCLEGLHHGLRGNSVYVCRDVDGSIIDQTVQSFTSYDGLDLFQGWADTLLAVCICTSDRELWTEDHLQSTL